MCWSSEGLRPADRSGVPVMLGNQLLRCSARPGLLDEGLDLLRPDSLSCTCSLRKLRLPSRRRTAWYAAGLAAAASSAACSPRQHITVFARGSARRRSCRAPARPGHGTGRGCARNGGQRGSPLPDVVGAGHARTASAEGRQVCGRPPEPGGRRRERPALPPPCLAVVQGQNWRSGPVRAGQLGGLKRRLAGSIHGQGDRRPQPAFGIRGSAHLGGRQPPHRNRLQLSPAGARRRNER